MREVIEVIEAAGGKAVGVLVALDREEVGTKARIPAAKQLEAEIGIPLRSIITLTDLVDHMEENAQYAQHLPAVRAYRNRYGAAFDV